MKNENLNIFKNFIIFLVLIFAVFTIIFGLTKNILNTIEKRNEKNNFVGKNIVVGKDTFFVESFSWIKNIFVLKVNKVNNKQEVDADFILKILKNQGEKNESRIQHR